MSQTPRLILPPNVAAQRDAERENQKKLETSPPSQKRALPPEVRAQARELWADAQTINQLMTGITEKGVGGWVALISQPVIQKFLQNHQDHILPQVILEICRQDRTQILNAVAQVMQNEIATNHVNHGNLDAATYRKALGDIQAVMNQIKVPPLTFDVSIPEFDLSEPESES